MIEIVQGDRGIKVLRRDGRLLASRFDPWGEAEAWLARRSAFIGQAKTIFVLGLGSGYHVAVLLKRSAARVVVIEPDPELITAVQRLHALSGPRVRIECVADIKTLRASEVVREALRETFVVLMHPSCLAFQSEFFKECRSTLLGRDWGALTWQWQIKGLPELDSTARVDSTGEPLTIYDLEQTELVQNSEERERLLLKALRELVK